jgi:hypothetical protein
MTPVAPLIERPIGSPVAVNAVGLLVPVTLKVNGMPVCAETVAGLVMTGGPVTDGEDERQRAGADGVGRADGDVGGAGRRGRPEITPVEVLIESPAGNPVALKLAGLLVAVIW